MAGHQDRQDLETGWHQDAPQWLTVSEASALLLVSPSTLRRWTVKRLVPVRKTAGGHRRYSRAVIQSLAHTMGAPAGAALAAGPATDGPPDWSVFGEQLQAEGWYATLGRPENLTYMRALGQRLLGLLIQHISRPRGDERFLGEARQVGVLYGLQCARSNASLQETMDAFLFFRRSFARTVLRVPRLVSSSDSAEMVRLTQLSDLFMDAVLSGIAEGFEPSRGALPGAPVETGADAQ